MVGWGGFVRLGAAGLVGLVGWCRCGGAFEGESGAAGTVMRTFSSSGGADGKRSEKGSGWGGALPRRRGRPFTSSGESRPRRGGGAGRVGGGIPKGQERVEGRGGGSHGGWI